MIKKLNTTQKKQTNTAKQNYPGSVTSYDTRPKNEVGLFYNILESTRDMSHLTYYQLFRRRSSSQPISWWCKMLGLLIQSLGWY